MPVGLTSAEAQHRLEHWCERNSGAAAEQGFCDRALRLVVASLPTRAAAGLAGGLDCRIDPASKTNGNLVSSAAFLARVRSFGDAKMERPYVTQKTIFSWALSILFVLEPVHTFAADKWLIARASTSGACHVQLETSRPILGVALEGRYSSRKEACEAATKLKTSDPSESKKCYAYTKGTIADCKDEKVKLE